MAKLTAKARNKLPAAVFGQPAKRAYPMPDASHAANAKARATQAVNAGRMSSGTEAKIDAKANKVMGAAHKAMPAPMAKAMPKRTQSMGAARKMAAV